MSKNMIKKDSININRMIEQFCKKYDNLITFLHPDEIELLVRQVVDELPEEMDFNPEFQMTFLIEKKFFLKARDEILAGNIDLEILIVEEYLSTAKFLLRKIGYSGDDSEKIAEEAVIESIENYEAIDGFKSTILKSLKRILNPVQQPVAEEIEPIKTVADSVTVEVSDLPSVEVNATLPNTEPEEIPIEDASSLENSSSKDSFDFDIPDDELVRMPNQLELLIRSIDIIHQIPVEDELYLKFISLKYGYYKNQYFGLDEIASILSIPLSAVIEYYNKSLQYVKDWFGLQLDKMYTYYIKKSE